MNSQKYYDLVGKAPPIPLNSYRFQQTLTEVLNSGSLLDIGCGQGEWLKLLSQETSLSLTGMDISPVRLEIAKKSLTNFNINWKIGDITHLSFKSASFDQITSLETLEHLPNWKQGLSEILRVAKQKVIITIPYDEQIKNQTCENCGNQTNIYGHLHTFKERDFKRLNLEGKINFKRIYLPFKEKQFIQKLLSYSKQTKKEPLFLDYDFNSLCTHCNEDVPFEKYFYEKSFTKKIRNKLKKLKRQTYLLVTIDKN